MGQKRRSGANGEPQTLRDGPFLVRAIQITSRKDIPCPGGSGDENRWQLE